MHSATIQGVHVYLFPIQFRNVIEMMPGLGMREESFSFVLELFLNRFWLELDVVVIHIMLEIREGLHYVAIFCSCAVVPCCHAVAVEREDASSRLVHTKELAQCVLGQRIIVNFADGQHLCSVILAIFQHFHGFLVKALVECSLAVFNGNVCRHKKAFRQVIVCRT